MRTDSNPKDGVAGADSAPVIHGRFAREDDLDVAELRSELTQERARRIAAEETADALARLIARSKDELRTVTAQRDRAEQVSRLLFQQTTSQPALRTGRGRKRLPRALRKLRRRLRRR